MTTHAPAVIEHKPLAPLDLQQTKASMDLYQTGLRALLDDTDWQRFADKKTGEMREFLKRSGWRKIALWFNLNLETRNIEIDRDRNGNPLRARVIGRATAPNGRYAEGEGGCSLNEPRQFQKPENDLPATAATRAVNRAISNLVGLGAVSAEEVDAPEHTKETSHHFGPLASEQLTGEAAIAVQHVRKDLDGFEFVKMLARTFDDGLPECAARTLKGLAWWVEQPQATGNEADVVREPESTPEQSANQPSQEQSNADQL